MEFFRLSSFMWTGCFAVHLYQIIWKNVKDPEVFEIRYHAASWGLPTLVSLYFVLQDETGMQMMGQSDRPWYVKFPICVKLVCSRRVRVPFNYGVSLLTVITARCWIRDYHQGEWDAFGAHMQYMMFYGPLLAIFLFNLLVYSFLGRKVVSICFWVDFVVFVFIIIGSNFCCLC